MLPAALGAEGREFESLLLNHLDSFYGTRCQWVARLSFVSVDCGRNGDDVSAARHLCVADNPSTAVDLQLSNVLEQLSHCAYLT